MSLFEPVRIGRHTLPSRLVMAPMTRNRTGDDGVPTPLNATYYRQRAGAGLIVTEATQVSLQGIGYPWTPGIHAAEQAAGWRRVTEAVHAAGGHIFVQLFHGGRISHPTLQPDGALPVAPSAIAPEGNAFTRTGLVPFVTPRAIATAEIPGIVADYAAASRFALEAGFDGVEIHGANGYLPDQFLRDGANRRTDRYGGSAENRARFLVEVTEAAAAVLGADRVGVRLSPHAAYNDMADSDPATTFGTAAELLDGFGLAYLHLVEGGPEATVTPRFLRSVFRGPIVANGGYDKARAEAVVGRGDADLVAFGATYLANPDLPERLRRDAPLNEPDRATFYGGDQRGYTDYPALDEGQAVAA